MYRNLNTRAIGVSGRQSEVIELALSYQFKGMDIDIRQFMEQVELYGLEEARRLIDSAKIRISSFPLPFAIADREKEPLSYEAGMEKLPQWVEIASQLGCKRVIYTIAPASDERPYHENFEHYSKSLAEVCGILLPFEMTLGLAYQAEPRLRKGRAFQFVHRLDEIVQLVKMTSAENIGVVLDLWQLHVSGQGFDAVGELTADQIVSVLLSDIPEHANLEEISQEARLLPGETGVIDSQQALMHLAEIGYAGPVTIAASRASFAEQSRDKIVQLAAERFVDTWKDAGLNAQGKLAATAS